MKRGDILHGKKGNYLVLKDFEVTGGMSKISDVKLDTDGKTYFIKEFLSPKFPGDKSMAGNAATVEKRKARCKAFENHHMQLNKEIAKKSSIGGNLISAYDFFRHGTTYFKVCEKVDVSSISISEVSKLPVEKKLLIIRTIVSSLKILHDINIVHGDLKQDNILLKSTSEKKYVAKLIDFDNSYFGGAPPASSEEVVGTQEYYSPELALYIIKGDDVEPADLTIKSDVFALGILFSEYWCGKKPEFEKKYKYVWQQVLDGRKPGLNSSIPPVLQTLIGKMLFMNHADRPDLSTLIAEFRKIDMHELTASKPEASKEEKKETEGKLRGKLLGKIDSKPAEGLKEESKDRPKLRGKLLD